jgi:hypothetical protein
VGMARAVPVSLRDRAPQCAEIVRQLASAVTYGWGMAPRRGSARRSRWRTSLFPKDGGYVLPLRDSAPNKEEIALDDNVHARLIVLAG